MLECSCSASGVKGKKDPVRGSQPFDFASLGMRFEHCWRKTFVSHEDIGFGSYSVEFLKKIALCI